MKRVFSKCLLLVLLSCFSSLAMAQNEVMVRGAVTAAEDGFGLPGAYVQVQNRDGRTVAATVTDLDGNYSLMSDGKKGNVIIVSYSGYKKQTIEIGSKSQINVSLREDVVELAGATIVAQRQVNTGMMNINERDLTSASKRIDMSELSEIGTADVADALQGRIAGVDMVASSGAPGAGMAIRIRGTTSINGSSQPLIVVDGFPFDATISDDFDFGTANEEDYSQLLNVSPSDIQDITVLKDAAATAIYGSKAANGVLLITTKRGGVGKPRIQYSFRGQVSQFRKEIPTLSGDEYVTLIQEELMNAGTTFNPYNYPELANDANNPYNYYNYGQNTNWFDEVTRTGFAQDHSVSISGGDSKAQYYFSFNYYDQSGIVIGQDYMRLNPRLKVDYNISEKLKVQASIAYTYSERDQNYVTYLSKNYDVLSQALVRAPNMSVYEYNEAGQLTGNYFTPEETLQGRWSGNASNTYNPVAMAKDGFYKTETHTILPNLSVIWRPFEWIRYSLDVGFQINNDKKNAFLPQTATGRPWTENTVNKAVDTDAEAFNMNIFNKVLFTPNLGENHSLQFLLGTDTQSKIEKGYGSVVGNTASVNLIDPTNGGRLTNGAGSLSSYANEYRKFRMFTQVHYSFMDRYIVSAAVSRDGSSKFGSDHRWGTYPSASARWRISGEPFMKWVSEKWLDEFSLRFSWGITGNEVGSGYYPSVASYGILSGTYLGAQGTQQNQLEYVDLRWEDTNQYNAGLNFSAFQGRATLEFDWYKKNTKSLYLNKLNIPTHTGFSTMAYNAATMNNKGWELQGTITPIRNKDWTFEINFNVARNDNRLDEISELYAEEQGDWTAGDYVKMIKAGQPLGSFYGFMYDGVYLNADETIARDAKGNKIYSYDADGNRYAKQMTFNYPSNGYEFQPGDARYVDVNNDGNIDAQDIVYLGNFMPELTGGFGFRLKYKAWQLSTFFNFRYGNDIVNSAKKGLESMSGFGNQSKAVLRRWRHPYEDASEAPNDLLPRAVYGQHYNYLASDRFVEDGSFVRFKQLTLKYTVPQERLKNMFISQASVYATVQNLFCWSNYTGMDPEISVSNPLSSGYDNATSPRSREYWVGLNLSF